MVGPLNFDSTNKYSKLYCSLEQNWLKQLRHIHIFLKKFHVFWAILVEFEKFEKSAI